jgi:hypothetical protein
MFPVGPAWRRLYVKFEWTSSNFLKAACRTDNTNYIIDSIRNCNFETFLGNVYI